MTNETTSAPSRVARIELGNRHISANRRLKLEIRPAVSTARMPSAVDSSVAVSSDRVLRSSSGSFLASSAGEDAVPAQRGKSVLAAYYLRTQLWGVGGQAKQLVEAGLDGVHLGDHAPRTGTATGGRVDHHGLLDPLEVGEELPDAHDHACVPGL